MLGVTPVMQRSLVEFGLQSDVALSIGALFGAFFAAGLSHPLDTIKTCMQGDVAQAQYTSVTGTGRTLAQQYGVRQGLFKGLVARIGLISTTFFLQAPRPPLLPSRAVNS